MSIDYILLYDCYRSSFLIGASFYTYAYLSNTTYIYIWGKLNPVYKYTYIYIL